MKWPPSGYILAQKSWGKFPTALRRCVLKTEVSIIFFTRKPPMLHPLYLYLYRTTPVSKPAAGAVTEAWRLRIWHVYSSTYLEKEGYYSAATSAEKRSQTSTSYCKESIGALWWSDLCGTGRQANHSQKDGGIHLSPRSCPYKLHSESQREKLWRKLKMTQQKFEQRTNSLPVHFTLEVKPTANKYYSRSNTGHTPFAVCLTWSFPIPGTLYF